MFFLELFAFFFLLIGMSMTIAMLWMAFLWWGLGMMIKVDEKVERKKKNKSENRDEVERNGR